MPIWIAEAVLAAGMGYALAGLAVAIAFLAFGIERVDPAARGAYGMRPLLLPGLALLWPLVIWRWARLAAGRG
ncbi:hypothetical protein [Falsiroseomonas tokyonensis]|uniref:Uncharacterized protein n=1 Tax=Falsiroseomonas tokyonensis TaxID=430521 RepID=A0ABV7BWH6_9PROT|nr:hypothetical protein [Falsiroseomonas tokyonensis]MBU8538393.1 hypothetical protein [Falsiroseomonas tokyonensis]